MTILHTQNLQVPYPDATELVANGSTNMQGIAQAIDGGPNGPTVTRIITGPLAQLPSSPSSYALGTIYQCTDAACIFLRSAAATWMYIAAGQSPPPIGAVQFFAGNFDPIDPDGVTRWMICDGRVLSTTIYVSLYAVIGTTFGGNVSQGGAGGTPSGTFNIPFGANNIIVGANVGTGVTRPLASLGGEAAHSLTASEMPVHGHVDAGHTHVIQEAFGAGHAHDAVNAGPLGGFLVSSNGLPGTFLVTNSSGIPVITSPSFSFNATTGLGTTNPWMNSTNANFQPSSSLATSHDNHMPYLTVNQIIRVL